jgi:hypothetical protein
MLFPKEFSDLLNKSGTEILNRASFENGSGSRLQVVPDIIKEKYAANIVSALDKRIYPILKKYDSPIRPEWQTGTRKNFTERLGKTMKFQSVMFNTRNTPSYKIAEEIGLVDMLRSESYKRMGEVLMNKKFGTRVGNQAICYEDGGYVSPHTDYFPEFPHLKKGYFDIHLMFSNKQVKHQWLIYEKNGFLNETIDISVQSAIAVYNLPFWHYTTPLMPVNDKKGGARRWLLLGSFEEAVA